MGKLYDVIISGAGPVGLFLASELALARMSVLVLERNASPDSPLKDAPFGFRGANTLTLETLARRGLLYKAFPDGVSQDGRATTSPATRPFQKTDKPQFGGHFAGMFFDLNKLDISRWKYRINAPGLVVAPTTMAQMEAVFSERAERLGAVILRGQALTKIIKGADKTADHVEVEVTTAVDNSPSGTAVAATTTVQGRWLVGCDGGRSLVRKAAGFAVEGTEPTATGYAMKCTLENSHLLQTGFILTDTGMYITRADDRSMVYMLDPDHGAADRQSETTLSKPHLQQVLARVTGVPDVRIQEVQMATSFTDRARQATSYRQGRVLLAGDAAHTHATYGAQGMNLGLGDAMNLGWKLASVVRKEKEEGGADADTDGLLDTYTKERMPVATDVLDLSRAQSVTMAPDPTGRAVRRLMQRVIDTVDGTNMLVGQFWGLAQKYDLAGDAGGEEGLHHDLVGRSMPDLLLADGARLNAKLATGHGLVVDLGGSANPTPLKDLASVYPGQVDYIAAQADDKRGLQAMVVRPDGVVAWAVDDGQAVDGQAVKAVMEKWFL